MPNGLLPVMCRVAGGFVTLIAAVAAAPDAAVAECHSEGHEHRDQEQQGSEGLVHGYSSPAKPMKASDRLPAMISVRPVPFAMAGSWVRGLVEEEFGETNATNADLHIDHGHDLMEYFLYSGLKRSIDRQRH